jgi:hypothetical protein
MMERASSHAFRALEKHGRMGESGGETRRQDGKGKAPPPGRAHVVGGVESLRDTRNDQAVAPFQIVKEINGARAVGLRKFAVKPS